MHIKNPPACLVAQMHQLHMPLQRPTRTKPHGLAVYLFDFPLTSRQHRERERERYIYIYIYIYTCAKLFCHLLHDHRKLIPTRHSVLAEARNRHCVTIINSSAPHPQVHGEGKLQRSRCMVKASFSAFWILATARGPR